MFNQSNLIYSYDGSFEGLMCCVFESYAKKEIPVEILPPDTSQATLFKVKKIITDSQSSSRVFLSIHKKNGLHALDFVRHAFLTCFLQKELYLLLFLSLGYHYGPAVMNMLTNNVVNTLSKAIKGLNKESQLFRGFPYVFLFLTTS
jgi:probable DNA metabolism protein